MCIADAKTTDNTAVRFECAQRFITASPLGGPQLDIFRFINAATVVAFSSAGKSVLN